MNKDTKTFHTVGIGEYFISTPEVVKNKSNLNFFFNRDSIDNINNLFDKHGTEEALEKHTLSNGIALSFQNVKDSQIYIVEVKNGEYDIYKFYFKIEDEYPNYGFCINLLN